MKYFGNLFAFVVSLSVSWLITPGNCAAIDPSSSTINIVSEGSTMVDVSNDGGAMVISVKDVPTHVTGLVDAKTGFYHLTAQHEPTV